jgi:hypothetical protein
MIRHGARQYADLSSHCAGVVVGAFFVTQEVLTDPAAGKSVSVANDVAVVLVFWVAWAFLTPAVLLAIRRWPLDAKPISRPCKGMRSPQSRGGAGMIRSISTHPLAQRTGRHHGGAEAEFQPTAFVWGVFTVIFFTQ